MRFFFNLLAYVGFVLCLLLGVWHVLPCCLFVFVAIVGGAVCVLAWIGRGSIRFYDKLYMKTLGRKNLWQFLLVPVLLFVALVLHWHSGGLGDWRNVSMLIALISSSFFAIGHYVH